MLRLSPCSHRLEYMSVGHATVPPRLQPAPPAHVSGCLGMLPCSVFGAWIEEWALSGHKRNTSAFRTTGLGLRVCATLAWILSNLLVLCYKLELAAPLCHCTVHRLLRNRVTFFSLLGSLHNMLFNSAYIPHYGGFKKWRLLTLRRYAMYQEVHLCWGMCHPSSWPSSGTVLSGFLCLWRP